MRVTIASTGSTLVAVVIYMGSGVPFVRGVEFFPIFDVLA
jgi:hypothetical protein